MTNEDLIKKWLSRELSDAEKKEFESTEDFAAINKLTDAVKAFKAPEYDVDKEYSKVSGHIFNKGRTISFYERMKPVLKIAAIFIITLTIGYFSYNSLSGNNKWIAEQKEIYLPDSSLVLLNKGSKIKFAEKKWEKERNVELKGEAFFKVKKGSRFNVKTQQGLVTVLGTEFVVKDWANYYEVTCYSGLVKVVTKQNTVLLKPNSVFRIINGKEEHYTVPDKLEPDWLKGESSFNSVPYSLVIKELERQYNVSVETRNIDLNQLFTGGFSHNNIEIAIKSITFPLNLHYQINGSKIIITFENK